MKRKSSRLVRGAWAAAFCTSALAWAGETPLTTELVVTLPSGNEPNNVIHPPGDFDRLFIPSLDGRIYIVKDGVLLTTPFIDIDPISNSGGEQGLLGVAFHPDYANNGEFYLHYTNTSGDNNLARYRVSEDDPDVADPDSGEVLLTIDQPQSNHNGGWIGFSPLNGYLHVALGDGGNFNDTGSGHTSGTGNAQDITDNLLGKILRLDVNGGPGSGYSIPPTNPFVGVEGDDEIWIHGLRNPWRDSFDRETGDLWIGDVGQDAREEVSFQPGDSAGGENYGWRCMEGFACTGLSGCTCNDPSLTLPVHDYPHPGAGVCTVVGGYVYRGCAIPSLQGTYFFADYCSNQIWSFRYDGMTMTDFQERTSELDPPGGSSITSIIGFGEDAYGEIYLCEQGDRQVHRIVADTGGPVNDCNENGVEDACDILDGTSDDADGNGTPDECEPGDCDGDANGDNIVDPLDAGFVLARFGCVVGGGDPDCDAADVNGDSVVDPLDVGYVLARFGDCP